uniref:Glycerophosphoryl diester phosphodiesterase n=1 Tax=Rheinheimera sp. BAL341 TaxID=1708203 RepID=A0A486XSW5_9GAMM
MIIAAHRGNRLNAPENTITALISAYTSGADVLEFDVQLTRDHQLVVAHDGTVNRLCGLGAPDVFIRDRSLHELRWSDGLDFSNSFNPSNVLGYRYLSTNRRGQVEIFPALLDRLPRDIEKLIELKHDSSNTPENRDVFVRLFAAEILNRGMQDEVVVYSKDHLSLRLLRGHIPGIRTAAFDWELSPDEQIALLESEDVDGLVTDLDSVLVEGSITDFGLQLREAYERKNLRVGVILYPYRKCGTFSLEEYDILSRESFIWSVSTDTTLQFSRNGTEFDLSPVVNPSYIWLNDDLMSDDVDRDWFSLGYAKANQWCYVYKDQGVHIQLDDYDGYMPPATANDPLERRLDSLEFRMLYAEKSWPFYSGGGLGIIRPIEGDFTAIVDYELEKPLSQAQTLEMAVTNVDPANHRGSRPERAGHADAFFDPHGCPPYVGVEHDENDGYRINWNFGSAYDNNQYGPPIGNGAIPMKGTLRLERRGNYFSAYYKTEPQAPNWICVGVVKNQTLNKAIYLRCVAKRWLQESEENPGSYYPVLANKITFKNLKITKPIGNKA